MSPSPSELMVQVIGKIPLFKAYSPSQVRMVLGMCEHRVLEAGQKICNAETPAEHMFILVAGELTRLGRDGKPLDKILPVASVGEVQIMTGRAHSASVQATKPSHIFAISRFQFERMLRREADVQAKTYKNLTDILVSLVKDDQGDARLAEFRDEKQRYEARITTLERQLRFQGQKLGVVLDLFAKQTDMTQEQIKYHINEELKDLVPRVLVVDDEPDFRRFVREVLDSFSVIEAESGREALDIVFEEPLDLIISDIRMPEMDGCALLENLRSKFPGLPVLAVSGYVGAEELRDFDFDDFILKPVEPQKLQEAVEAALAKIS